MAKTTVKGIRVGTADVALVKALQEHRAIDESESEILLEAARIGLLVMASGATAPGPGQYGGLGLDQLTHRLRTRLLGPMDFLAQQGQLPTIFGAALLPPGAAVEPPTTAAPAAVSGEASASVLAFSGGFLDDDE